jgi:AcrR family transcriptional regulator
LLALASEMIAREGVEALSMRRLAQAAGCSTTVLYNLFGAKHGIIDALYVEGFARLAAAHASLAPSSDPIAHIVDLCLIYRRVALENPIHYGIMFGGYIPDFVLSEASRQAALDAMQPLMHAISDGAQRGLLHVPDVEQFGMILWSVAHGFVSLEIAGMYLKHDGIESLYIEAVQRLLRMDGT